MAIDTPLFQLRDRIHPAGALDTLRIQLLPWVRPSVDYYEKTFTMLEAVAPDIEAGRDTGIYTFAYDWRRSGDENAVLLAGFIKQVKARLARHAGGKDMPKLDLVAHSGGTQIARYYLRYGGQYLPQDGSLPRLNPQAAKDFQNVILLGPPNRGTITSLMATANGHQVHQVLPYYARPVTGSMPGIYQLIPRSSDHALIDPGTGESLDPLSYDLWVRHGWGLAHPDCDKVLSIVLPHLKTATERRQTGLDHLKKCLDQARRYQQSLDRPAPKPENLSMILVIGQGRKTVASALAYPGKLEEGAEQDGDRTVPAYSASQLPDYEVRSGRRVAAEWDAVMRCNFDHDGLANNPRALSAIIRVLAGQG